MESCKVIPWHGLKWNYVSFESELLNCAEEFPINYEIAVVKYRSPNGKIQKEKNRNLLVKSWGNAALFCCAICVAIVIPMGLWKEDLNGEYVDYLHMSHVCRGEDERGNRKSGLNNLSRCPFVSIGLWKERALLIVPSGSIRFSFSILCSPTKGNLSCKSRTIQLCVHRVRT